MPSTQLLAHRTAYRLGSRAAAGSTAGARLSKQQMNEAFAILPVRNRRELTLRCLRHLRTDGDLDWLNLIVVDDGSSDGTGEAVRTEFPEVHLIRGDGNLWWTGAICAGMEEALQRQASCIIWLNDDTLPHQKVLPRITTVALQEDCIASARGRVALPPAPELFMGLEKTSWGLRCRATMPREGILEVDACRGNCVAIPRSVVKKIGLPDSVHLPQYYGDTDYTMRARASGIRCLMLVDAWADEIAHSGDLDASWLRGGIPFRGLWSRFAYRGSALYWRASLVYSLRHWGFFPGLIIFARPYFKMIVITLIRVLIPHALYRKQAAPL
jgi:GT2 family glycosyltransferase